jgi:hypothetical protein
MLRVRWDWLCVGEGDKSIKDRTKEQVRVNSVTLKNFVFYLVFDKYAFIVQVNGVQCMLYACIDPVTF